MQLVLVLTREEETKIIISTSDENAAEGAARAAQSSREDSGAPEPLSSIAEP